MTAISELTERVLSKHSQVRVRGVEVDGHEWIAFAVPVCPRAQVRPNAMLVHNLTLAIGQLAISEGQVVLFQTLPLPGILWENVEETVGYLVREAPRAAAAISIAEQTVAGGEYE